VAHKKGINETQLGIIFSIETLASFITITLLGKKMAVFGRKNILLLG